MTENFSVKQITARIRGLANEDVKSGREYFGIKGVDHYGLSSPQMKSIAKEIGRNHKLALELWETGIHEARHIAVLIADPKSVTEKLMEKWLKDFNSWDIVDNCCGTLFNRTDFAFDKAMEWSHRKKEFEKRAGFALMAMLAVHDKKAHDASFLKFFPHLYNESGDDRNFVKKAINWAIRQIGKRNMRLCDKAIGLAEEIRKKGDKSSLWISSDALRELRKYRSEGKIKNIGQP